MLESGPIWTAFRLFTTLLADEREQLHKQLLQLPHRAEDQSGGREVSPRGRFLWAARITALLSCCRGGTITNHTRTITAGHPADSTGFGRSEPMTARVNVGKCVELVPIKTLKSPAHSFFCPDVTSCGAASLRWSEGHHQVQPVGLVRPAPT